MTTNLKMQNYKLRKFVPEHLLDNYDALFREIERNNSEEFCAMLPLSRRKYTERLLSEFDNQYTHMTGEYKTDYGIFNNQHDVEQRIAELNEEWDNGYDTMSDDRKMAIREEREAWLVSRSATPKICWETFISFGENQIDCELADDAGLIVIRAKGRHWMSFNGDEQNQHHRLFYYQAMRFGCISQEWWEKNQKLTMEHLTQQLGKQKWNKAIRKMKMNTSFLM